LGFGDGDDDDDDVGATTETFAGVSGIASPCGADGAAAFDATRRSGARRVFDSSEKRSAAERVFA
jgi:hypothetical protein